MGIFDRLRKGRNQETPASPGTPNPYPVAVKEYLVLARDLGVTVGPDEVRATYGEQLERDAGAYLIRAAESLPYPAALIAAALNVALADTRLAPIREHVLFAMFELNTYLPAAEREPYADAIDSVALQFATIAQPEVQRLMTRDPDAALKLIAGLPAPQLEKLAPLEREIRRRRTARWVELLTRFPDWWTPDEKSALYSEWMLEQAVDVMAVSRAAYDELQASSGPEWHGAFERFQALMKELTLFVDGARSYEAASGGTSGAYSTLVAYAHALLIKFTRGIADQSQAQLDETNNRFEEVHGTLGKLAAKHAEATKAAADEVLRTGRIPFPPVQLAPDDQRQAPRRAEAEREPKGFLDDVDDADD